MLARTLFCCVSEMNGQLQGLWISDIESLVSTEERYFCINSIADLKLSSTDVLASETLYIQLPVVAEILSRTVTSDSYPPLPSS